MTKRVALYLRVSTDGQTTKNQRLNAFARAALNDLIGDKFIVCVGIGKSR